MSDVQREDVTATLCDVRGFHRTDSYQWAHLPVSLVVRCKDCDERLWHNDPPADEADQ